MGDASDADKVDEADGSAGAASMPSLYEAIGGEGPVRAVLQSLYDRLFDDAMIGFLFAGKDKAHIVEQQLAFTCRFLGGPQAYEGLPLPKAHAKLPLLPGHFDRRHRLLEQVLEAQGVPVEVKRVWLQIDSALRPSVLASAEEAREKTRT
jgi:hemoglobin